MCSKINGQVFNIFKYKSAWFDEDSRIVVDEEFDAHEEAIYIEVLMLRIFSDSNELFEVGSSPLGRPVLKITPLGKTLLNYLKKERVQFLDSYPSHEFSAPVETYVNKSRLFLNGFDVLALNVNPKRTCEKLNEFVDSLRLEMRNDDVKAKLKNFRRKSDKNLKSVVDYMDSVFDRYSRLLVLRVDLAFRKEFSGREGAEDAISYDDVKKYRDKLFKGFKQSSEFEGLVGYVWKLEYTRNKGFHYHFIFLFDGSKVRQDVTRAKMIGEYWVDSVTLGKGIYFNCNAKKLSYRSCGVGMISHSDEEGRNNLRLAAAYLTKTDYYIKFVMPDGRRTFGKGAKPKAGSLAGRKRREKCAA